MEIRPIKSLNDLYWLPTDLYPLLNSWRRQVRGLEMHERDAHLLPEALSQGLADLGRALEAAAQFAHSYGEALPLGYLRYAHQQLLWGKEALAEIDGSRGQEPIFAALYACLGALTHIHQFAVVARLPPARPRPGANDRTVVVDEREALDLGDDEALMEDGWLTVRYRGQQRTCWLRREDDGWEPSVDGVHADWNEAYARYEDARDMAVRLARISIDDDLLDLWAEASLLATAVDQGRVRRHEAWLGGERAEAAVLNWFDEYGHVWTENVSGARGMTAYELPDGRIIEVTTHWGNASDDQWGWVRVDEHGQNEFLYPSSLDASLSRMILSVVADRDKYPS